MTCVETLFNPDLNNCRKTIKAYLEKVELGGNIMENYYLWVFLHLSFYFEIIFKMHAAIRKTRRSQLPFAHLPPWWHFAKQLYSITVVRQQNTVKMQDVSIAAEISSAL